MDEFVTSGRTLLTHDYSLPRTPLLYDPKSMHRSTLATIIAISRERGVEYVNTWPRSVDQKKFITFLKELRRRNQGVKIMLFCDRLAVHRCKAV